MYMKRGFTLIEVTVVVTVILILTTVGVFGFNQYRQRAATDRPRSIANAIKSGAERYYSSNNEYPSAQTLFTSGGATAPSCTVAPDYNNIYSKTGVASNTLNGSQVQLITHAGANCTWDQNKVYYLTKTTTDANATRAYTISGCTYTLTDSVQGHAGASYLIAYFSRQNGWWFVTKSNFGTSTTSDGIWCPFRSL